MTKPLTTEQHQMLEDLTGKQYTRFGTPRKIPRSLEQTIKMGLYDRTYEQQQATTRLINKIKQQNPGYNYDQIKQQALLQGHQISKIQIMLSEIRKLRDD